MNTKKLLLLTAILLLSGFFTTTAENDDPIDLTEGLVAYWSFDEGEGDIIFDESSNHNDVRLMCLGNDYSNPKWVDGRIGYALQFDGVDDYVQVGDTLALDITEGSWQAWIFPKDFETEKDNNYIIDKYHVFGLILKSQAQDAGRISGYISVDGNFYETISNRRIPLNQWSYLVVNYDRDTLRIYINGSEESVNSAPSGDIDNGKVLHIGQYPSKGFQFNGIIDEVRIYNRALTEDEIMELYRQGRE